MIRRNLPLDRFPSDAFYLPDLSVTTWGAVLESGSMGRAKVAPRTPSARPRVSRSALAHALAPLTRLRGLSCRRHGGERR